MYLFGLNLLPCINRRYSNTMLDDFSQYTCTSYIFTKIRMLFYKKGQCEVFFFRVDIKSVYFWIVNYFNTDWQNMWPKTQNVNEVEENFVWIKSSPGGATASASIPRSSHVRIQNYFRGEGIVCQEGSRPILIYLLLCTFKNFKFEISRLIVWLSSSKDRGSRYFPASFIE